MTDQALIMGCKRRDKKSQRMLYDKYSPRLFSISLRYMRNRPEAEDVLQEAFIRVFNSIHQYSGKGSLLGWMRRITINVALRKKDKMSYQKERSGLEKYESPSYPTAISDMSAEEIMEVINNLPEGYRQVFNMYVIDGYNHKEIAKKLHIEETTSRSQLFKARKLLKKILKEINIVIV